MNRLTEAIPFQSVRAEGPENTLAEYVNSFKRRAWLIVACALGCAGAAAAWSFIQTPMYQAKATVVIEGEGPEGIERDKVYRQADLRDRKSTRLNSSHIQKSRMPSSA